MTLASLLALVVARRLGLRTRLIAQAETGRSSSATSAGSCSEWPRFTLLFEAIAATVARASVRRPHTTTRPGRRSAAASSTRSRRSTTPASRSGATTSSQFVTDGWISLTISSRDHRRRHRLPGLAGAAAASSSTETVVAPHEADPPRDRPAARGWLRHGPGVRVGQRGYPRPARASREAAGELLPGRAARTAGFNTLDYAQMEDATLLVQTGLMFIGAGSAVDRRRDQGDDVRLLALMVWTEIRGDPEVNVFGRRIPSPRSGRRSPSTLIALSAVAACTLVLVAVSDVHGVAEHLRVRLGVRYRRALHRHHRRSAGGREGRADRAHVPRTHWPAWAWHGARAA